MESAWPPRLGGAKISVGAGREVGWQVVSEDCSGLRLSSSSTTTDPPGSSKCCVVAGTAHHQKHHRSRAADSLWFPPQMNMSHSQGSSSGSLGSSPVRIAAIGSSADIICTVPIGSAAATATARAEIARRYLIKTSFHGIQELIATLLGIVGATSAGTTRGRSSCGRSVPLAGVVGDLVGSHHLAQRAVLHERIPEIEPRRLALHVRGRVGSPRFEAKTAATRRLRSAAGTTRPPRRSVNDNSHAGSGPDVALGSTLCSARGTWTRWLWSWDDASRIRTEGLDTDSPDPRDYEVQNDQPTRWTNAPPRVGHERTHQHSFRSQGCRPPIHPAREVAAAG